MQQVQIGRSPVYASRVILGAAAIGRPPREPQRRIRAIRAAVEAGLTTIDIAPVYGFGACERIVGLALRGIRDQAQIFSKVGLRWDDPDGQGAIAFTAKDEHGHLRAVRRNSRPESLRLEVERSLHRLGVDVLDAVHVQQLDVHTPIAETMGALKDLLREGKLRAIGVSQSYSPWQVLEAQRALGDVPLASVQVSYNLLRRDHESDLLPLAREHGIGVLAHSPLEMGLLAGELSQSSGFAEGDLRRNRPAYHPDNLRRISQALQRGVEPVATRHGASIAQVVLAWVLAHPGVTAVVAGASRPEHACFNAEAARIELGADERLTIQRVFEQVRLDPYAGLGLARRTLRRGQRVAGGVRRVMGALARLAPEPGRVLVR